MHVYNIILYINCVFVQIRTGCCGIFFIFVFTPGQYSGERLQDHWSSGSVLNHLKFDFYKKISSLHLSSANWIFTINMCISVSCMMSQKAALILTHFNLMLIIFV